MKMILCVCKMILDDDLAERKQETEQRNRAESAETEREIAELEIKHMKILHYVK